MLAGLCRVPLVLPSVDERLAPSGQWGVSLPQTVFCVRALHQPAPRWPDGPATGRRAGSDCCARRTSPSLLGPVLVYGGGVDALAAPVAVLSVVANVALVYQTFAVSRRLRPGRSTTPTVAG